MGRANASGVVRADTTAEQGRARLGVIADGLCGVFWVSLAGIGLLGALPEDAFGVSNYSRNVVRTLLPEGWAFFTRNPRERVDHLYEVRANGELVAGNPADERSLLGFDRKPRLRSAELAGLVSKVPESAWISCRASLNECLRQESPELQISITMNVPAFCGRAVIQSRTPVPWAWRKSYDSIHMPSRFVRVNVDCKGAGAARG